MWVSVYSQWNSAVKCPGQENVRRVCCCFVDDLEDDCRLSEQWSSGFWPQILRGFDSESRCWTDPIRLRQDKLLWLLLLGAVIFPNRGYQSFPWWWSFYWMMRRKEISDGMEKLCLPLRYTRVSLCFMCYEDMRIATPAGCRGGDGGERDWDGGRFGAGEWRESGNRKRVREPAASSTSLSRHASSSSCASSSRRRRRSSCYRTRRKLCGCDVCCVRKVWHYIMYCHFFFFSRGDGLKLIVLSKQSTVDLQRWEKNKTGNQQIGTLEKSGVLVVVGFFELSYWLFF